MTIQTMRDFGIGEGQIYVGGRWVDSSKPRSAGDRESEGREPRRRGAFLHDRRRGPRGRRGPQGSARVEPPNADGARRAAP